MADTLFVLSDAPHGGKCMQSRYELSDNRVVDIDTRKRSNGRITTTASVSLLRDGILTHAVFSDFYKTLATSERGARATAKAVEQQHKSVNIEELKAEIAQYDKVRAAKATIQEV